MGLDMYLNGEKYHSSKMARKVEEGVELKREIFELGYWRKHPNLHGYIVETFAGGVDECQRIDLSAENLQQILDAVKKNVLPHTDGFFFGGSDSADYQDTIGQLGKAVEWLNAEEKDIWRSVNYQASW